MRAFCLALALAIVTFAKPATASELIALEKCPISMSNCVVMEFTAIIPDRKMESRIEDNPFAELIETESTVDWATYRLHLSGAFDGGSRREFEMKARSYVGGMQCNDFAIAVVGIGPGNQAEIFTNRGRLSFDLRGFEIASGNTLGIIDKREMSITWLPAPHWDRSFWHGAFAFHTDGTAYFEKENSKACLKLGWNGPFEVVPKSKCTGSKLVKAGMNEVAKIKHSGLFSDDEMNSRAEYDLFAIPDSPFLVYQWSVACT